MSDSACAVAPCDHYGTNESAPCAEGLHRCSTSGGVWVSIDEHTGNSAVLPNVGQAISAAEAEEIAKGLIEAAAIVRSYRSPARLIQDNVRVAFISYDYPLNSVALREVLEVSVHRGRALWAGRARYTTDELDELAAYFDIDPQRWTTKDLRIPWPNRAQRQAARLAAEDRVITFREERRRESRHTTEGIAE